MVGCGDGAADALSHPSWPGHTLSALTLHRTPPAPLLQLGGGSKAKQLRSAVELAPALTEEAASKLASEDPPQLGRGGRGASATPVSESPATLGASPRGVYTHMHTHLCTHRALLHTCGVWREAGGGRGLGGVVCAALESRHTHPHTHLCTHRALLHTCGVWREAGGGTLVGLVCGGAQADALSLACCWLAGRHVPDGLVGQPAHRGLCQPGLHGSSRVRAHCSAR
jgi:hypothetical protein